MDFKSSQQGNETKDDTNNKWLSGLQCTKSPEEAEYSDWSGAPGIEGKFNFPHGILSKNYTFDSILEDSSLL